MHLYVIDLHLLFVLQVDLPWQLLVERHGLEKRTSLRGRRIQPKTPEAIHACWVEDGS